MDAENEEVPLVQPATDASTPTEYHNHNKIRRRNVPESASLATKTDDSVTTRDRVPLVILADSAKAWHDGATPRIPDLADVALAAGKQQNGVLTREDEHGSDYGATTDALTSRERMKMSVIRGSIANPDLTLGELRLLGCSSEGFVNDDVRRVLWPKLLRLAQLEPAPVNGLETVHTYISNEIYQQILKDVARSGSHISPSATEKETESFQEQLTQLMCWVLHRHSQLNYYQGYNDVAATVLLVMGLQAGLYVLESISLEFLERFMEKTMEKVNQELFYIFALLERVHPTLLEHLENIFHIKLYGYGLLDATNALKHLLIDQLIKFFLLICQANAVKRQFADTNNLITNSRIPFYSSVELFPHFALAEYTTWYAHKYAENRKLLHRLFDFFLGSPPLMPLYLSTVIVAHRATEIFNTTPDMGHTHKVLCTLPDDLPFETLLVEAKNLYRQYPPESINNDVRDYDHKRKIKEQEWKTKAEASRQERERQRKLKIVQSTPRISYRIRSYKTITVVTILALGIYAFIRSSTGLN